MILVSGGLDSATTLAIAKDLGFACYAISFDYSQRNRVELQAAAEISSLLGVIEHKVIRVDWGGIGGSALTDSNIPIPEKIAVGAIPVTYVPARNTLFLAFALGWAEILKAQDIFIGVNTIDYSGYPDCCPEFIKAFEYLANLATCASMKGQVFHIQAPLLYLSKAEIIRKGINLGIDYSRTVSCYQADEAKRACGVCDSCRFRKQGFLEANIADPTIYYR
ncbi:exsB protein [Candidatus Nitrosoglobus terrae]|uniref:7-cyano-7-deazaguanine synthase n=1 Tax=Candidatus Nitrosoglobus terrae TaxID=1630141 RepID=A0A1Q2SK04_9GAMM|nr:exsB protein [Candidatus Nitrosoglobus terrae]